MKSNEIILFQGSIDSLLLGHKFCVYFGCIYVQNLQFAFFDFGMGELILK